MCRFDSYDLFFKTIQSRSSEAGLLPVTVRGQAAVQVSAAMIKLMHAHIQTECMNVYECVNVFYGMNPHEHIYIYFFFISFI